MTQKRSRKERRAAQKDRGGTFISFWAVAFLDLLGYRQVLNGLDVYPMPPDAAGMNAIRQAFTKSIHLRRRLLGGINQFLTSPEPFDFSAVPANLRPTVKSWRQVKLFNMPGPDHIVLGSSLARSPDHFPVRGVYTLMVATASAMLVQLMIGADDPSGTLPLRGGIDVAPGGFLERENFLYSPALTRAYDLEQEGAVYPRTLVGNRLADYLKEQIGNSGTPAAEYARQVAEQVQGMLFTDKDGKLAVDFFGQGIRSILESDFARKLAEGAWRYARQARDQSLQIGNQRVLEKYEWLLAYMESRTSIWNINT